MQMSSGVNIAVKKLQSIELAKLQVSICFFKLYYKWPNQWRHREALNLSNPVCDILQRPGIISPQIHYFITKK